MALSCIYCSTIPFCLWKSDLVGFTRFETPGFWKRLRRSKSSFLRSIYTLVHLLFYCSFFPVEILFGGFVIYSVLCILFIPPINPAIPSPSFWVCLKILFRVSPLHVFLIQFEFDMVVSNLFKIFQFVHSLLQIRVSTRFLFFNLLCLENLFWISPSHFFSDTVC